MQDTGKAPEVKPCGSSKGRKYLVSRPSSSYELHLFLQQGRPTLMQLLLNRVRFRCQLSFLLSGFLRSLLEQMLQVLDFLSHPLSQSILRCRCLSRLMNQRRRHDRIIIGLDTQYCVTEWVEVGAFSFLFFGVIVTHSGRGHAKSSRPCLAAV